MGARTKARRRAVELLFEADQRGLDPLALLDERLPSAFPPIGPYAAELVRGVQAHRERIDELLTTYAQGWTLERMPGVDRVLLRIGTWELIFNDDVPDAVAVDEAVDLARLLSTDDSPSFVNGLLGQLLRVKPSVLAAVAVPEAARAADVVPVPEAVPVADAEPTAGDAPAPDPARG